MDNCTRPVFNKAKIKYFPEIILQKKFKQLKAPETEQASPTQQTKDQSDRGKGKTNGESSQAEEILVEEPSDAEGTPFVKSYFFYH
jgi:hypothetical protein